MKVSDPNRQIQRTIESITGIQQAEPSPFLFGKIMDRLKNGVPEPVYYSGKVLVRFALAMLVLGALNAFTIRALSKPGERKINDEMELNRVAQEYFGFENTTNYLY